MPKGCLERLQINSFMKWVALDVLKSWSYILVPHFPFINRCYQLFKAVIDHGNNNWVPGFSWRLSSINYTVRIDIYPVLSILFFWLCHLTLETPPCGARISQYAIFIKSCGRAGQLIHQSSSKNHLWLVFELYNLIDLILGPCLMRLLDRDYLMQCFQSTWSRLHQWGPGGIRTWPKFFSFLLL
jgi:hypothetical protein